MDTQIDSSALSGTFLYDKIAKTLTTSLKKIRYQSGQCICHENAPAAGAYILLNGLAKGMIRSGESNLHVSTYKAGQVFGFAPLLDGRNTNLISVLAAENCEVICIPRETLFTVLSNEPGVWQQMLANLSRELISVNNKIRIAYRGN